MVVQDKQFLISKDLEIYACTIISNEEQDSDDKKSGGKYTKRMNKIEKITIQLFSYKSDINTIKEFVEELTKKYLSSIEDLRDNKRFIYTLTKAKYDESRYELWDENLFSSTFSVTKKEKTSGFVILSGVKEYNTSISAKSTVEGLIIPVTPKAIYVFL
jgi:hypothetical protein